MLLKNKNINVNNSLIVSSIFTLLYLPLLFAGTDLWDGVILSHSIQSGQVDVFVEWFTEAGLVLTPWFYLPLSTSLLKHLYPFSGHIISLICLLLSAFEAGKIAQHLYKISDRQRAYVTVFYMLLPVWASFSSTVFLMHSATIYLALLCARLVISGKNIVLAYALVLITFQQASLAPLVLAILMLDVIERKGHNIVKHLAFGAWVVISFFVLRKIFGTTGLYSEYNKININFLIVPQYWREFSASILLYCCMVVLPLILKPKNIISLSLLALIIAVVVTIVPYIAVAKYPLATETFTMHSHSMRFMFSSAPVLALLFGFTLSKKINPNWFIPLLFIYMGWLFYSAQTAKIKDIAYQRAFITAVALHPELNGKVVNFINNTALRPYEYADIFAKAFGENKSYPLINGRNLYPKNIFSKESYLKKYILPARMPTERVDLTVSSKIDQENPLTIYRKYLMGDMFSGYVTISYAQEK